MSNDTSHRLHLDYETASDLNLKQVGAYKYAADPSTRVLMLGWALDDEPVALWQPRCEEMPTSLMCSLEDNTVVKHAYNAPFERLITRHCLGVEVPYSQWRCTLIESYYLGFAGSLDQVLRAIGLEPKDARGNRLISLFCTPAPKSHKADWYDWDNKPLEWQEFCQYCLQDVHVERQLGHWLRQFPAMPSWDWDQWFLDQSINDRGVVMDLSLAHSAIEMWDTERQRLTTALEELTGLSKVTREPFLRWVKETTGFELESTRKDYLAALLSKGDLLEEVRPQMELWAQKEGKATSKYLSILHATGEGSRARGMFQYKGASRTDRVSGRVIQLQNLKKPFVPLGGIESLVSAIKSRDPQLLKLLYPQSVSEALGGAVRHAITASPGHSLVVCDLASVESVILGWIAQCPLIDQTFRSGRDSYKMFASRYFGIRYEDVTKDQRGFSKPPVLGCGFMLGWRGLVAYAEGYGVKMEKEQAQLAVNTFRGMYPEIPKFWSEIYNMVKAVVLTGVAVEKYRLSVERDNDFLRIWLPSGRALSYYKPEIQRKEAPWSTSEKPAFVNNFCYMGLDDKHQWTRIFAHAGGVTENIVQSIAGDLLWHGITNANASGLPVVVHVHDEIVVEVPDERAAEGVETLRACMMAPPAWALGLWIGAEGFITKRYSKN